MVTYPILLSLKKIEVKILDKSHTKYIIDINQRYHMFCTHIKQISYPPSYITVAGFLSKFVEDHKGSAKSINNITSAIHVMCHYIEVDWLTESQIYQLNKVKKQLKLNDTVAINRKSPILLNMLRIAVLKVWNLNDPIDHLVSTMSLVAHNCLFRGQDLLYGIKVYNVTWNFNDQLVTIHVKPGKTAKDGSGFKVYLKDFKGPSGYKFLLHWFKLNQLWNNKDYYIFPKVILPTKSYPNIKLDFRQKVEKSWFWKSISKMLQSLNYDSDEFSVHSFRAGGATDLFSIGIPYPKIKKYGRWKSDAALVYYRDEIEIAATIASAFGSGISNL